MKETNRQILNKHLHKVHSINDSPETILGRMNAKLVLAAMAECDTKRLALLDVSVRTWTADEVIEILQPFKTAENAAIWFDMYGR